MALRFQCLKIERLFQLMGGEGMRGYGATAARLTPDQKAGSSNLSGLIFRMPICLIAGNEKLQC